MRLNDHDVAPAIALGHSMVPDPPFHSTSDRQTCCRCGKCVVGSDHGIVYGSALDGPCPASALTFDECEAAGVDGTLRFA